jgi:peroxiredoxin
LILGVNTQCPVFGQNLNLQKRKVYKANLDVRNPTGWSKYYKPDLTVSDWEGIKAEFYDLINKGFGPRMVRLAWHDAGSYDVESDTGGPHGAIRYPPVSLFPEHAGLGESRILYLKMKEKYPSVSYADLFSFGGAVVISNSGGPIIEWRPGRADTLSGDDLGGMVEEGHLPESNATSTGLTNTFSAMGLDKIDIVALSGAHCLGRVNAETSGFSGQWSSTPKEFNTAYFSNLMKVNTTYKTEEVSNIWFGEGRTQTQYQSTEEEGLQMLLSDVSLTQEPSMFSFVQEYSTNQDAFFAQFKISFEKLLNLGVGDGISENEVVNTVISQETKLQKDPSKVLENNGATSPLYSVTSFNFMAIIIALAWELFL